MIALPVQQSNIIPFPSCDMPTQGKSNEWYTPAYIIEAARRVLGTIDLDPASCEQANQVVRAKRFYSAQENGLAQAWHGRVWCNPPYGRTDGYGSNIGLFAIKLVEEYKKGNVTEAILLSTAKASTSWFNLLWDYPICFVDHIVGFYIPEKRKALKAHSHIHGTILVYLGTNEQAFISEFSKFGHIAKSIAGPRHETVQARLWGAV